MEPLIIKTGDNKRYDIGTMTYHIRLRGDDTEGRFTLIDFVLYPGAIGPGEHYHKECMKTFFVLKGRLGFEVAGEKGELSAGEILHIPKGTVHDFANAYDGPCRFLLYASPAGLEYFFEDVAESGMRNFKELLDQYAMVLVGSGKENGK
ncbi:MAG: cupin domain-containing protein [Simkaniaceae bacterium]|nr:cupin domain-containing protein [Simkaniaceae bacterium]